MSGFGAYAHNYDIKLFQRPFYRKEGGQDPIKTFVQTSGMQYLKNAENIRKMRFARSNEYNPDVAIRAEREDLLSKTFYENKGNTDLAGLRGRLGLQLSRTGGSLSKKENKVTGSTQRQYTRAQRKQVLGRARRREAAMKIRRALKKGGYGYGLANLFEEEEEAPSRPSRRPPPPPSGGPPSLPPSDGKKKKSARRRERERRKNEAGAGAGFSFDDANNSTPASAMMTSPFRNTGMNASTAKKPSGIFSTPMGGVTRPNRPSATRSTKQASRPTPQSSPKPRGAVSSLIANAKSRINNAVSPQSNEGVKKGKRRLNMMSGPPMRRSPPASRLPPIRGATNSRVYIDNDLYTQI